MTGGRRIAATKCIGGSVSNSRGRSAYRPAGYRNGLAGLEATALDVGHVGHTYDGKVADAASRALPDFLRGDEHFALALGDLDR